MKSHYPFRSAVYLLLIRQDEILLSRRCNTGYRDGEYGLVSGHLDGGETVRAAMAREAQEEAGLSLEPGDLSIVHVIHRKEDDGERIDWFLVARDWQGEPVNKEPHKCDDMRWFPLGNLPEATIPYIRFALERYAEGKMFSEVGF